ncbi:nucleotidyltransferase family protein [uncultured Mucilaginibacter sp.]|uniref:nucleotidyltransferase family protein n=1 Tax=uncultured Mucilaginibacter sp. TaxID=797541 RepID=UPI0025F10EA3|nr:nucleotidyltransferase family protein [uncultured Mucilaginibacter sp.]
MTGIIILAAGSSSRLGKPKQNLIFKGKTLLQRAIETAIASVCEPVVVVLGGNAEAIEPTIKNYDINIIHNPEWNEGMSSSIRTGLSGLLKIEPNIQSVILMLCDQPFTDTYLLNHLIMANGEQGITACSYNNTTGPPVLFDVVYFKDLLSLKGTEGAKKVIHKYPDKVIEILFPHGSVDIDTIEDFEKLNRE